MYIITRKGVLPIFCETLERAVLEAIKIFKPPCWIWKVEASRVGTLKKIEVDREEIQKLNIGGIYCILNRSKADQGEPAEGQIYFSSQEDRIAFLVYHRQTGGKEECL